jgi:hypothetical protein
VRWLAVGNLLAETRARGFAARLLAGLKIEARVYVYDREGDRGYGSNGGCGGGCGGTSAVPEGFPPVGRYDLTTAKVRGAVVVAPGRHTVYYLREAPTGACGDFTGCGVSRDVYRVEYLADLLRSSDEDLKLEARPFHEVVCKDARQCRRALSAVRDEIARAYEEVLARLLAEGLLDPTEAAGLLKPDVTLDLTDMRDARTFRLPDKLKGVKISPDESDAEPPADPAEPAQDAPAPPL